MSGAYRFELSHALSEEPEGVEPGQEHIPDDVLDALLHESEFFTAHDGRVDQVEPERVGAVLVDDDHRVGIVLQPLAHLLAITVKKGEISKQKTAEG